MLVDMPRWIDENRWRCAPESPTAPTHERASERAASRRATGCRRQRVHGVVHIHKFTPTLGEVAVGRAIGDLHVAPCAVAFGETEAFRHAVSAMAVVALFHQPRGARAAPP